MGKKPCFVVMLVCVKIRAPKNPAIFDENHSADRHQGETGPIRAVMGVCKAHHVQVSGFNG